MNAERLTELAALNAVGALDGADLQEFGGLLAQAGPQQREDAARFDATAALVGAVSAPRRPSAELKSRIMGRLSGLRQAQAHARAGFYSIISNEGQWQTLPVPGVRVKTLPKTRNAPLGETLRTRARNALPFAPSYRAGGMLLSRAISTSKAACCTAAIPITPRKKPSTAKASPRAVARCS